MKKSFLFMSVLLALLAGSLVTSCDLAKEIADELAAPTDTWCEMYVQYGTENKVSLKVDAIYVDDSYTGKGASTDRTTRKKLSPDITLQPGITLVVSLNGKTENTVIQGLTSSTYIIKTFPKDSSVEVDDDTSTGKVNLKGSKVNWNILYRSKADFQYSANQFELPEAPDIITYESINDGNATAINDADGFSWSKLLKQYLLTSLVGKLE